MASINVSPTDRALTLILDSFRELTITREKSLPVGVSQLTLSCDDKLSGSNTIISYLATQIPKFRDISYTELEKAEVEQWLTLSNIQSSQSIPEDTLDRLNETLKFRTTILGEKWSVADVAVYVRVKEIVRGWNDEQRTGEKGRRHIVRWLDFVQNSEDLGLVLPEGEKVDVDVEKVLFYPKPDEAPKKEKKLAASVEGAVEDGEKKIKAAVGKIKETAKDLKEIAATASTGGGKQGPKTEKKQKQKREPVPPKEEPVVSPSLLDLRVGHILHCRPHPNADSLFVSIIAMGDDVSSSVVTPPSELSFLPAEVMAKFNPLPPVRTVCSGLNGLVPLPEMQDRKVVVVANLKPVTMRGVKSCAMVLCASPPPPPGEEAAGHKKEYVEIVMPPNNSAVGERVFFEGYEGTPEAQLNPKKKLFEQIQPGFLTTDSLEVAFDRTKAGWIGDGEKGKAPGSGMAKLVTKSGGVCKAPSLKGANVS